MSNDRKSEKQKIDTSGVSIVYSICTIHMHIKNICIFFKCHCTVEVYF